ncbi:restriction endonuclease subunit S [Wielerella bovis]|nr:restriction endonuclease subunit S [Wielerella bovis]ULJ64210.1 restriction endonuclease subunit S [Wielerella bovis]
MSEILLSELENFNDLSSEYYLKDYVNLDNHLKNLPYKIINDFYVTDGEHGSPDWDENSYIRYITAENIMPNYIFEKEFNFISEKQHRKNERSNLQEKDLLIYSVGAYAGYCAVAEPHLFPANIPRSVAIVRFLPNSEINPYFASVFLNSKYGDFQTKRFRAGNSQPMLALEKIKQFKIFQADKEFQQQIEDLYKQAYEHRLLSKQKYTEAEDVLLENLDLINFQAACNSVNVKSLKESFLQTGRLDAEYYQIKYEQYWNLIQSQDYVFIRDEYLHITEKPDWKNQPYQYIEIGDVNISDGSYQANCMEYQDLPENAKIQVKQGDILISTVRPYRGAVTIIGANDQDLVVSGAFTVLRKKPNSVFNNEVLKVLLRSKLYKDWLLQFNVGTSYPVIKDEDILNLPIPKIDETIQTQIANYIQQSNDLREKAKTLLAQAKSNVELEIENISLNINNLKDCGG